MDLSAALMALLVGLTLVWWWLYRGRPQGLPPCPGVALPVIGHLHLLGKDPRKQFQAWRSQHGDVFSLFVGSRLVVVLNGSKAIKEALVRQADIFSDRPKDSIFTHFSRDKEKGIADASGPQWKIQRKTALEILRRFGLGKNMLAIRVGEEVAEFIKALVAKNSQPYDPSDLIHVSVSNNICSILFGKRFDYDDEKFLAMVKSLQELLEMINGASVAMILPFLRHVPGDLFKAQKAVDQFQYIVRTFVKPIIVQHVQDHEAGHHNDFISAYLQQVYHTSDQHVANIINETNLERVIMDLFVGGTDTTAVTIRWALVYFLHHPQVQEKCYKEIAHVIGTSRTPQIEDKPGMAYIEATITEVLRMSAITTTGVPHATACDTLLYGYFIPKDTMVLANLDSVLYDPDTWQDPDTFRPERFLTTEGKLTGQDLLIPFSTGRRVCLGESLARVELFLYLTSMIQRFRFLPPEDGQLPSLERVVGIVNAPKPFKLRAVERN